MPAVLKVVHLAKRVTCHDISDIIMLDWNSGLARQRTRYPTLGYLGYIWSGLDPRKPVGWVG